MTMLGIHAIIKSKENTLIITCWCIYTKRCSIILIFETLSHIYNWTRHICLCTVIIITIDPMFTFLLIRIKIVIIIFSILINFIIQTDFVFTAQDRIVFVHKKIYTKRLVTAVIVNTRKIPSLNPGRTCELNFIFWTL